MSKTYTINGKAVKGWFRRGSARIPIFEDGSIGHNLSKHSNKEYKKQEEMVHQAKEERDRLERYVNDLADDYGEDSPDYDGSKYELQDAEDRYREEKAKYDKMFKEGNKIQKTLNNLKSKTRSERARAIDKANSRKALGKGLEDIGDKETTYYFQKEWNEGLKKSIEMEKDNYTRRKRNGDSVENLSNMNRNIQEMELQLQKEKSKEKALGRGLKEIQKDNQIEDNTLDKLFNDNKNEEINYAGKELYEESPKRYGDKITKVNEFNKREEVASSKRTTQRFLSDKSEGELRKMAQQYGLKSEGLSKKQLLAELITVFNDMFK